MEGEIGRFRRRHLTPIPHVGSLAVLNAALAAADARDDGRRIGARIETVGQAAARELPLLRPLPAEAFDVSLSVVVPGRHEGPDLCPPVVLLGPGPVRRPPALTSRLGAATVHRRAPTGRVVAEHVRSLHKGSEDLVLDHYLEVLAPQARRVRRVHRLGRRPRQPGRSPPSINGSGTRPGARLGDGAGTRALVGVLLLHRTLPDPRGDCRDERRIGARQPRPGPGRRRGPPHPPGRDTAPPVPLPAAVAAVAAIRRPTPIPGRLRPAAHRSQPA